MAHTNAYSESTPRAVSDKVIELGEEALERTTEAAAAARDSIKNHPIATVVIIAGLAFAVGALWKIGQSRQHTRVDSLLGRLADLQTQLPRRWRM